MMDLRHISGEFDQNDVLKLCQSLMDTCEGKHIMLVAISLYTMLEMAFDQNHPELMEPWLTSMLERRDNRGATKLTIN